MMGDEVGLLQNIIRTIGTSLTLPEMLGVIAKLIGEAVKGDSCLIYLLDSKENELILRGAMNPHPRLLGKIKMKLGEGITGWVAQHRQPVAIPEKASEDPRFKYFQGLPEDRYEAFLSVPVILQNQLLGVINVQHRTPHRYSVREISVLTSIADLVAGAIEKLRLQEEAETAKAELRQRKLIERAKGILMKREGYSEEEAFRLIQKTAMNKRKTMAEVAEAILLAEEVRSQPEK